MVKAEGKKFSWEGVKNIRTDFLEVFDFNSPSQYIKIITKELSAVCPFSGLPDIAKLIIEYYPEGGLCIELKSLKYYITSFRNVGIYQEAITKKIYNDLKDILRTNKIRVTTNYNIRGGFLTKCCEGDLYGNN